MHNYYYYVCMYVLTCRQSLLYNVGKNDLNLQLTIRGVDLHTKQQLTKIASRKGVSLNNLIVKALKQIAGTNTTEDCLHLIQETLRRYRISSHDIATSEIAIAEMDIASKTKQKHDENDFSF